MQTPSYFMTEESEKAAKWEMLETLQVARSRLSALLEEAEKIGKSLKGFGRVLQNSSWVFAIDAEKIVGNPTLVSATEARSIELPLSYLSQTKIEALLGDIGATQKEVNTLKARLRDAGLQQP